MAEIWKRTVTSVSEKIFPGLYHQPYAESGFLKIGNEIVSNLPLQMSLYFNVIFFPFWLMSIIVMLQLKYECLTSVYQFIVITVVVAVSVIECLRLYLGYLGNLTEKIPELAGFWMLSVLLQFPLQMFLFLNEDTLPMPLERAVQMVMILLLVAQLGSGFMALRHASKHQAAQFHLLQFETFDGGDTQSQGQPFLEYHSGKVD